MQQPKRKARYIIILLATVLAIIQLSACRVSNAFLRGKEAELYPDTSDFPNTKWSCKESEISFWILDGGENTVIGTYVENQKSYRLIATFSFYEPAMDFTVYSSTSEEKSQYQDSTGIFYTHCERQVLGTVSTDYFYRDGELICTVRGSDLEQFPENRQLTFQQDPDYRLTVRNHYACAELKMEMDSFAEVDGYYKGTVDIDGNLCMVQFFEIGNENYYAVSIENGITNTYKTGTTSELIRMTLTPVDGGLEARVTDEYLRTPQSFPEWKQQCATFLFTEGESATTEKD